MRKSDPMYRISFLHTPCLSAQDLWMLHPDRSHNQDWTCRARGSLNRGNIIDQVAISTVGSHDAKICVADRSSDNVPMTDHRGIAAYILVDPPDGLWPSQVKFTHHDLSQHLGKPRLQYPSSSAKSKYNEFHIKVDNAIKAECLHQNPVNDDKSFMKCSKALTRILKQWGEAIFGQVKRGWKSAHNKITSLKIQRLQAQIKSMGVC